MESIPCETFPDMTQPWEQCCGVGSDTGSVSADAFSTLLQQSGVSGSPDSSIVGLELGPIDDGELKVSTEPHRNNSDLVR